MVTVDLRDMKWLSHSLRFKVNTSDPDVIVGNKEGTIDIDFSKAQESDQNGSSKY